MKNNVMRLCIGGLLAILAMTSQAAGPSKVAKLDTDFWPNAITSQTDFDAASRAEILLFLSVYKDIFSKDLTASDLGVKSVNSTSLDRWKSRFQTYWLTTFRDAAKTCKTTQELGCQFNAASFDELLTYSKKFKDALPAKYTLWTHASEEFYLTYLKEQARLAALFPHPTSEILPLSDAEIIGDHFKDKEFLITLDDGPTQSNDTAKYTQLLRDNGVSAFFFTLGDSLETKMKTTSAESLKHIYQGQCLASHGYHHNSHQHWTDWKSSIDKTALLVKQIVQNDAPVAFRPPYGQVQESLVSYLESQHSPIFLWNIDSEDWQSKMTSQEVTFRVKKLMLLWRKGIILFHDVHQKAFTAIPSIIQLGKTADLHWVTCAHLTEQTGQ